MNIDVMHCRYGVRNQKQWADVTGRENDRPMGPIALEKFCMFAEHELSDTVMSVIFSL